MNQGLKVFHCDEKCIIYLLLSLPCHSWAGFRREAIWLSLTGNERKKKFFFSRHENDLGKKITKAATFFLLFSCNCLILNAKWLIPSWYHKLVQNDVASQLHSSTVFDIMHRLLKSERALRPRFLLFFGAALRLVLPNFFRSGAPARASAFRIFRSGAPAFFAFFY